MSKVLRLGTDLHRLNRFAEILQRNGPLTAFKTTRFSERILHPTNELPSFQEHIKSNDIEKCSKILSGAWCVKEAIYKTLDDDDQKNFIMSEWYKKNDLRGRPIIGNENYAMKHPDEEFQCSISHDGEYMSSVVLRLLKG